MCVYTYIYIYIYLSMKIYIRTSKHIDNRGVKLHMDHLLLVTCSAPFWSDTTSMRSIYYCCWCELST